MDHLQNQLCTMQLNGERTAEIQMEYLQKSLHSVQLNNDTERRKSEDRLQYPAFDIMNQLQDSLHSIQLHYGEHCKTEGSVTVDQFEESLLMNGQTTDFTLIVGEKVYRVFKFYLLQRSSFLQQRYKHGLYDGNSEIIDLTDMKREVVLELLRFMYTGKVKNFHQIGGDLLLAADTYAVQNLRNTLEEAILNDTNQENVLSYLKMAHASNSENLKKKLIHFAAQNLTKIYYTKEYTTFKNEYEDMRGDIYIEYACNHWENS